MCCSSRKTRLVTFGIFASLSIAAFIGVLVKVVTTPWTCSAASSCGQCTNLGCYWCPASGTQGSSCVTTYDSYSANRTCYDSTNAPCWSCKLQSYSHFSQEATCEWCNGGTCTTTSDSSFSCSDSTPSQCCTTLGTCDACLGSDCFLNDFAAALGSGILHVILIMVSVCTGICVVVFLALFFTSCRKTEQPYVAQPQGQYMNMGQPQYQQQPVYQQQPQGYAPQGYAAQPQGYAGQPQGYAGQPQAQPVYYAPPGQQQQADPKLGGGQPAAESESSPFLAEPAAPQANAFDS